MSGDAGKRELRSITIYEDGRIQWSNGMSSIYEVFGFIDLHVNPNAIKGAILKTMIEAKEKKQEDNNAKSEAKPIIEEEEVL